MLYSLLYAVVRLLLEILIVRGRPSARLRAEVPALRHQLGVLERQVGQPRWQPTDRLLLAAISRALPRPAWRSLLPSPETLLRWHRELVRRQRPVPPSEVHELILLLARENARWGYRRIQGELLKLGHRCSHLTVRKVLRRHGLPPAPARPALLAPVRPPARRPDLGHRLLHRGHRLVDPALRALLHRGRESSRHLVGCTYSPTGAWVVQQARNLAWKLQDGELGARFLLRDRDSKFSAPSMRSSAARV